MTKLKPTLLLAYDKNDANNYIQSYKLEKKNVSLILSINDMQNLTKGHRVLKTDLAYINPDYNLLLGELSLHGYKT